jgi:hypothetical protein
MMPAGGGEGNNSGGRRLTIDSLLNAAPRPGTKTVPVLEPSGQNPIGPPGVDPNY